MRDPPQRNDAASFAAFGFAGLVPSPVLLPSPNSIHPPARGGCIVCCPF